MEKLKKIQAFINEKKKIDDLAILQKTNMLRRQFKVQEQLEQFKEQEKENTSINFLNLLNSEKLLNKNKKKRIVILDSNLQKMSQIASSTPKVISSSLQKSKSQIKFRPFQQTNVIQYSRKHSQSIKESLAIETFGPSSEHKCINTYIGLSQSQYKTPNDMASQQGTQGLQNKIKRLLLQITQSNQYQQDELDKQQEIEYSIGIYVRDINAIKEQWHNLEYLLKNHSTRFHCQQVSYEDAVKSMNHVNYNLTTTQTQLKQKHQEEHNYISIISNENQQQKNVVSQKEKVLSIILHNIDQNKSIIQGQNKQLIALNKETAKIKSWRNQFKDLEMQIQCIDMLKELVVDGRLQVYYEENNKQKVNQSQLKDIKQKNQLTNIFQRMKQSPKNELNKICDKLISEHIKYNQKQNTLQNIYQSQVIDKNKKEIELQYYNQQIGMWQQNIIQDTHKLELIENNENDLKNNLDTLNLLKLEKSDQNFIDRQELLAKINETDKFIFYVILAIINLIIRYSLMINKMFDYIKNPNKFKLSITKIIKKAYPLNATTRNQNALRDQANQFIEQYMQLNDQIRVMFSNDSMMQRQLNDNDINQKTQSEINITKFNFNNTQSKFYEQKFDIQVIKNIIEEIYNINLSENDAEFYCQTIKHDHIFNLKINEKLFREFAQDIYNNSQSKDISELKEQFYLLKNNCYQLFQNQIQVIFNDFCQIYFQIFRSYNESLEQQINQDPKYSQNNLRPQLINLKETQFVRDIVNKAIEKIIKQNGYDEDEYLQYQYMNNNMKQISDSMNEDQIKIHKHDTHSNDCSFFTQNNQNSIGKDVQQDDERNQSNNKINSLKTVINQKIQKYHLINQNQKIDYDSKDDFYKKQLNIFNNDQVMVQEVTKYKKLVQTMDSSDLITLNQQLHFQKQQIMNKTDCINFPVSRVTTATEKPKATIRNKSMVTQVVKQFQVASKSKQDLHCKKFDPLVYRKSVQNFNFIKKQNGLMSERRLPETTKNYLAKPFQQRRSSTSNQNQRNFGQNVNPQQNLITVKKKIGILNNKIQNVKIINQQIQQGINNIQGRNLRITT